MGYAKNLAIARGEFDAGEDDLQCEDTGKDRPVKPSAHSQWKEDRCLGEQRERRRSSD